MGNQNDVVLFTFRYLPMPLGKLRNYLWPAPSENISRELMRDINLSLIHI